MGRRITQRLDKGVTMNKSTLYTLLGVSLLSIIKNKKGSNSFITDEFFQPVTVTLKYGIRYGLNDDGNLWGADYIDYSMEEIIHDDIVLALTHIDDEELKILPTVYETFETSTVEDPQRDRLFEELKEKLLEQELVDVKESLRDMVDFDEEYLFEAETIEELVDDLPQYLALKVWDIYPQLQDEITFTLELNIPRPFSLELKEEIVDTIITIFEEKFFSSIQWGGIEAVRLRHSNLTTPPLEETGIHTNFKTPILRDR